jgi:hypothetical protein
MRAICAGGNDLVSKTCNHDLSTVEIDFLPVNAQSGYTPGRNHQWTYIWPSARSPSFKTAIVFEAILARC